jgi:hypothetical protein
MAYTYTWKLKSLKKQNTELFENAIVGTQWRVTATAEDGTEGSFDGATPYKVVDANADGFIDYQDLSEDIVLGWIKNTVSGSASTNYWPHISEQIQKQIDTKRNVILEVNDSDFPWSPTSGSTAPGSPAPL